MTVTLRRTPFSTAEIDIVTDAVMNGSFADDWPELQQVADEIAERLPELLRHARLPDNSDNRRSIVRLVLTRWAMPKSARPSRSYRRLR